MTAFQYSDPIDHAFLFFLKHYGEGSPRIGSPKPPTRPMNVAVTLARCGCDEPTVVAGIVRYVFEEAAPRVRPGLEHKVEEKFGRAAYVPARDATYPKYDAIGRERPWMEYRREYIQRLTRANPATLDVVAAHEIHWTGSAVSLLERLGGEYLRGLTPASDHDLLWWYRSIGDVLAAHGEWERRPMLEELRRLSARLMAISREVR